MAGSGESPVARTRPRAGRPPVGPHPRRRRPARLGALIVGPAAVAAVLTVLTVVIPGSSIAGASTTTTAPSTTATTSTSTTSTSTTSAPLTTADAWVLKAIHAAQQPGSVRIDGKITQGKTTILLDLLVNSDGEGGGVFVQDGSLIRIERVGPLLYFDAPASFWSTHANPQQAKAYGGKWLELSALDARFTSFDQFLDAADLVTATFQGHTTPLTVRHGTYQGHKVAIVKDVSGAGAKRSTGLMYITATGTPHVVKIVNDTPGEASTLVFSHYGKPVSLTVPPEAINLT